MWKSHQDVHLDVSWYSAFGSGASAAAHALGGAMFTTLVESMMVFGKTLFGILQTDEPPCSAG